MGFDRSLPTSSVKLVVETLLDLLPEESAPAVIVVKPERPTSSRATNGRAETEKSNYDPGVIYLLELATILTLRDSQTLELLGERLLTSLQAFIRDAKNLHSLALSRIIYYLLNLLRLSHVCLTHLYHLAVADTFLGAAFHASAGHSPWYLWV